MNISVKLCNSIEYVIYFLWSRSVKNENDYESKRLCNLWFGTSLFYLLHIYIYIYEKCKKYKSACLKTN